MNNFKIDDIVETQLGVGRIVEVRDMAAEVVYLVEIQTGGFGRGLREVFGEEEIAAIDD